MNIPAPTPLAAALAHIEPFRPKGIGLAEPTALCPIGLEDFLTRPFPFREMVCAPWLPVSGLAMLYAPRGVGKTHVALALAYAVASGGRFLKWHAPRPRRVLVIDGEMPAAVLQERLLAISEGSTLKPPSDDYLRILASDLEPNGLPDLSSPEGQLRYGQILDLADLIIIDNLSTLCRSGRENEAESWLPVQSWALAQRRANRSVLFIHHCGKGGAQRGTSRKEDVLDSVVSLRRPEDYSPAEGARFEVHFEKSRGFTGTDAEPFEAALTINGWAMRNLNEALEDRVTALREDGLTQREIATEIGKSLGTVNAILKKAQAKKSHAPD
ncbi:MAG: AAA family ATPase [Beijerinckiaceae bacterium]